MDRESPTEKGERFERLVLPHLPAAYNLARWITRRDQDAEDAVQEGFLRAFRFFDGYRGGDARAWLLAIVRNACYTWLKRNRPSGPEAAFDPDLLPGKDASLNPEASLLQSANQDLIRRTLEGLPPEFREVIVLREVEMLSYKEIGETTGLPLGTVMSRLARGRDRLQQAAARRRAEEGGREL